MVPEDSVIIFRSVALHSSRGEVLRDVSFAVRPGSVTFVTGGSGAGKTTLLALCDGRIKPSAGEVILFGRRVSEFNKKEVQALRRRIGVISEEGGLMDHLSAFDNVALPLRLAGYRLARYETDVQELVTWVGLGPNMHVPVGNFSAGERQRVAIARAIVAKPELVLADDPTVALDAESTERVMRLLLNLHRFGAAVLIATTDRSLAATAGAAELRLSGGTLVPPSLAA